MRTIESLSVQDYIAFWDDKSGVVVCKPSKILDGKAVVNYDYGDRGGEHKTQTLEPYQVLAIGNAVGEHSFAPKWLGKYDLLQPERLENFTRDMSA